MQAGQAPHNILASHGQMSGCLGGPESYPSQDTWTAHLFTPITQGDKVDPGPWHSECTPSSQTDAISGSSCAQHKQGHWGLRASSSARSTTQLLEALGNHTSFLRLWVSVSGGP